MDKPSNPVVDRRASRGAVVLCGGGSVRMGVDKANLPFGPRETMLQRIVRIVSEVVPSENIVVVAAAGQPLPSLAPAARVVRDPAPDGGPLAALVEGLRALPQNVKAAFATGCDTPLVRPALVEHLFHLFEAASVAAVVPANAERLYPLATVLATGCLPTLLASLEAGRRSLHAALTQPELSVRKIAVEELRSVDPHLESFLNCNTPAELQSALVAAGISTP